MASVKFVQGTSEQYQALITDGSVNEYSFYYITDEGQLYLGDKLLTSEDDISTIISTIGELTNLTTTEQSNLVAAINEVYSVANAGGAGSVVTIEEDSTSSDYAKIYTVKQGETEVGTINIPKDMVVSSGEVVVDPEGLDEGTYIALTLANADGTVIYVNVGDLVDIYTAGADAAQVQLAISANNVITATLVAGGVGTDELADNAVTTAKVADGNITLAKLAEGVQTSLGLADSAVQSISTGETNGTINVDGNEVSVAGLGSAAYTDADAYDVAGAAAAVLGSEDDASTAATVYGVKAYVDAQVGAVDVSSQIETAIEALDYADTAVDGEYVSAVSEVDGVIAVTREALPDYSETYDAYGSAAQALTDAKEYADELAAKASEELEAALTWETLE